MASSLPAPPAPPTSSWRGPTPRRPPPRCGPLLARAAASSCRYRFRTDDDGVVDVAVAGKDGAAGYAVAVEAPSHGRSGGLVLRAAGSGEGVPLAPTAPGGALAAELSYGGARAPFHVSFTLADATGAEIRTHRGTSFRVPVGVGRGCPSPLGLSLSKNEAANFAVYSKSAKGMVLCLFGGGGDEPALEIELDPYVHRTGDVWHVSMESVKGYDSYGFRSGLFAMFGIDRPLLDPYAKVIGDFVPADSVNEDGLAVPAVVLNKP